MSVRWIWMIATTHAWCSTHSLLSVVDAEAFILCLCVPFSVPLRGHGDFLNCEPSKLAEVVSPWKVSYSRYSVVLCTNIYICTYTYSCAQCVLLVSLSNTTSWQITMELV
ncbi:uncharacterized protein [Physcomitrium patens]|uniref:uncharacterized protein isoform X1 n=1 Tax=Physcomitrium patens TaxID=3218 RepID=UPI003CCD84CD